MFPKVHHISRDYMLCVHRFYTVKYYDVDYNSNYDPTI